MSAVCASGVKPSERNRPTLSRRGKQERVRHAVGSCVLQQGRDDLGAGSAALGLRRDGDLAQDLAAAGAAGEERTVVCQQQRRALPRLLEPQPGPGQQARMGSLQTGRDSGAKQQNQASSSIWRMTSMIVLSRYITTPTTRSL